MCVRENETKLAKMTQGKEEATGINKLGRGSFKERREPLLNVKKGLHHSPKKHFFLDRTHLFLTGLYI